MNFIKIILIFLLTLLSIYLITVIALYSGDFVNSVIPGWRTTISTQETKLAVAFTFNIILPVYFMMKFKLAKNRIFISYFFVVNLLYGIGYWLKEQFNKQPDIHLDDYQTLLTHLFCLAIVILILHIAFYIRLLMMMRKER